MAVSSHHGFGKFGEGAQDTNTPGKKQGHLLTGLETGGESRFLQTDRAEFVLTCALGFYASYF